MRTRTAMSMVVLLLAMLAVTPADAAVYSCSGFAPTDTSCSTGTRTRVSGLSHDVAADFNYVGTIESALKWSGGVRYFRCTYTGVNTQRSCLASGTFPPVDASFTHTCRSLVPGTVITPAPGVGLNGVEGGSGTWQCLVAV